MRRYIWQDANWPFGLTTDAVSLAPILDSARKEQYRFLGALSLTPSQERLESTIANLTSTAVQSSDIEGERLDPVAVRSSVARRLGAPYAGASADDRTEGVVAMTLDATRDYDIDLTPERLFTWHAGLFPTSLGEDPKPWMGAFRTKTDDPMQIVSGPVGHARVHFEAPPGELVPAMMNDFIGWFNTSRTNENGLLRAATAHLWFETIHPFVDGNGRIGRAIADMALAQDENSADRFYSLSTQFSRDRKDYYAQLERAQTTSLDTTPWARWFVGELMRAISAAQATVDRARTATQFWEMHSDYDFNDRQRRVLWRILGEFEGSLNLRRYVAISRAPRATAQRDLAALVEDGVLTQVGQGKATHYELKFVKENVRSKRPRQFRPRVEA